MPPNLHFDTVGARSTSSLISKRRAGLKLCYRATDAGLLGVSPRDFHHSTTALICIRIKGASIESRCFLCQLRIWDDGGFHCALHALQKAAGQSEYSVHSRQLWSDGAAFSHHFSAINDCQAVRAVKSHPGRVLATIIFESFSMRARIFERSSLQPMLARKQAFLSSL
jgi:hypothetical protein